MVAIQSISRPRGMHRQIREEVRKKQDFRCYWCGSAMIDDGDCVLTHIIPLSSGGKHEKENLVANCHACNVTKEGISVESLSIILAAKSGISVNDYRFWGEIHQERKIASQVTSGFLLAAKAQFPKETLALVDGVISDCLGHYYCIWDRNYSKPEKQVYIVKTTVNAYSQELFGFYVLAEASPQLFECQEQITDNLDNIVAAAYPMDVFQAASECFEGYEDEFA